MAGSSLILYEPLDALLEKRDYWKSYATFYERYWGGPTSPYGVWFGQEYETFRNALSNHLEMDEEAIEDCFFMKDREGKYYVSPFSSETTPYILNSENHIPLHWFVPFKEEEKEHFFTPWGFGGIHYDTKVVFSLQRIEDAEVILKNAFQIHREAELRRISQKLKEIRLGTAELKIWLGAFNPSAYLVLNYGELCSFIHPYTLDKEHSAREIWQVLSFISSGRIEDAHSALSVLSEKWEDIDRKASGKIDTVTLQ